MNLANRTVLITGGGTGIGRATALLLAERGNHVIICGRREQVLIDTASEHHNISHYVCDLSDRSSIENLCRKMDSDGHKISMVINNAAILSRYNFARPERFDMDAAERDIAVNLTGPIALNARLLPDLLQAAHPVIVNVNSPGGMIPTSPFPLYSATKAGLHAYTQILRLHLNGKARVIEVFPPTVETDMTTGLARKKVSAQSCAERIIKGLEKGQDEIWIGEGKIVRWLLNWLPPSLGFKLVNSQPSMQPD